jgi:thiamine-monophosphate kinase
MVDLSDGLLADLSHIAAASGVQLVVDPAQLPLAPGATVEDALTGGEEYELALTAPPALDAVAFAARFGVPLTRVGHVDGAAEGSAEGTGRVRVAGNGATHRVELPAGHDHFSL